MRIENKDRVIITHLNINSIRNKIDMLSDLVKGKVDILCITETKLDETFPTSNFLIDGFSLPYRRDRTSNGVGIGGGILVYIRSDITSREIPPLPNIGDEELICIEISLYNVKWLIVNLYNPSKNLISRHLMVLGKYLDNFYLNYDNVLFAG